MRQEHQQKRWRPSVQGAAALLMGVLLLVVTLYSCTAEQGVSNMTDLEFFKSLDYGDGLHVVTDTFERFPLQYATTLGTDGNPQIRPIEFKFEEDGVLYFDTVEFYASYTEMQAHPYIQICVCDPETMTYIRLGGKVNFTRDQDIIDRCVEESPVLTSQFGENRDVVVAYYLTEVWAEFRSFSAELPQKQYTLPNRYDVQEAQ